MKSKGKDKDKFVVAVKDTSSGEIKPGKVLGSYRKMEFANHHFPTLVRNAGFEGSGWRVGIFQNGKCIS